ncbi:MAG TPA: hypothetical protein PK867_03290 [Pirellulales bacterium]|nr:hypothetical protein [Pirellulales bacterium]
MSVEALAHNRCRLRKKSAARAALLFRALSKAGIKKNRSRKTKATRACRF